MLIFHFSLFHLTISKPIDCLKLLSYMLQTSLTILIKQLRFITRFLFLVSHYILQKYLSQQ